MHLRTALLAVITASTMLACHGLYEIGVTDGGPGSSGNGGSGGGGGGGAGLPDGSVVLSEPDGGTLVIAPQAIVVNKVDLLFMIDNSASMGDKQAYLTQAIPDLVGRLVTPNCVSSTGVIDGESSIGANGEASCAAYTGSDPTSQLEFPAVHDMHIGILSSSLGPRLGDVAGNGAGGECLPTATLSVEGTTIYTHNDDQAHLLTRSSNPALAASAAPTEVPLADNATGSPLCSPDQCPAGSTTCTPACDTTQQNPGSGFLAWFPNSPTNSGQTAGTGVYAETSGTQLISDFSDLVAGVHEYGCGIESQLESWYRFLIQPDPYASLALATAGNSTPTASWVGVDTTILQERHDFLRPDSLVAIVDLTDEDDSEIDVRSIGGQGYLWMSTTFYPPHGTSECATNPADPACTACALLADPSSDPACGTSSAPTNYASPTDWGYDLNLRHVHMQAKYGLDPQFPIARYQNGLVSTKVPDRSGEYPVGSDGGTATSYVGTNDCTNPLFAASLPDGTTTDAATLCNLPLGPRTASLVYFLHIGGVPQSLLHFTAGNPAASELSSADWVKILGNDPFNYDYTGIDPHMIESYQPRPGLPVAPGDGGANPDPISGYEWVTNVGPHLDLNVDREYACIFPLAQPRDCSRNASGAYNVPANEFDCDCSSTALTAQELSPVCSPTTPTTQLYAKAYPTIRELELAKLLGPQGIVASMCPIDVTDNQSGDDPLYGYRPAVANLVARMKPTLAYTGK